MARQEHQDIEHARSILAGKTVTPDDALKLAKRLKGLNQFGYARKLLARIRGGSITNPQLRLKLAQQHALCTYKDPDLPTYAKLDRAFRILQEVEDLALTKDQETLGLAGAIFKGRWEADSNPQHLERSLAYYMRGYEEGPGKDCGYTGINAAYVLDLLAYLAAHEAQAAGIQSESAVTRRAKARTIREHIIKDLPPLQSVAGNEWLQAEWWFFATLAEAHFGLGQYQEALGWLQKAKRLQGTSRWEMESTARQLARLTRLTQSGDNENAGARKVLAEFVEDADAVQSLFSGKVGLALSGGGFRASLFHLGVLARLAELDMLRHVEVLSCVSGGSIVGAQYYLEVRNLLQEKSDNGNAITRQDYVDIVERVAVVFLEGVQHNLRMRVIASPLTNLKMLFDRSYSRTLRLGELFEEFLYASVPDRKGSEPRWLNELRIVPKDYAGKESTDFHPKYDNWKRRHKVPVLILNATTLNTGHNWQFTATYMGEPPGLIDTSIDGNYRLRRFYYEASDTPPRYQQMRLGHAVAASACVPGLFEPIALPDLYEGKTVRLIDGGVHDNQGVAGLLEQGCTVILVSDASGQMNADDDPSAGVLGVPLRANSILQTRIRSAQCQDLEARRTASLLRGLMFIHLKKDLAVEPVSWAGCLEMPDSDREAPSQIGPLLPYGILKTVQRGLSGIRTDLDSFSQKEAYALMTSGYRMTDKEFPHTIKGFPTSDERHAWPFLAIGPEMKEPHQSTALLRLLEVARHCAFKVWQLSPTLRAIVYGTLVVLVLSLVWVGIVYREVVVLSVHLGWQDVGIERTLTWGGLAALMASVIVTPLLGKGVMQYMGIIRYSETVKRLAIGLGLGLVGWLVAAIHLKVFDKLYLKYGRTNAETDNDVWAASFKRAQDHKHIGDMLVLAGEARRDTQRLEACRAVGLALLEAGQWTLAQEQFEAALRITPSDSVSQTQFQKLVSMTPASRSDTGQASTTRGWQPRQVLLFSGHMIDSPGRNPERFPEKKESVAAQKIAEALDQLGAGPEDLALTQGASGGDLLFLEACKQRGVRLQLLLPLQEPEFIGRSILPSANGNKWRDRFYTLKSGLKDTPRIMPDELGPLPKGLDPFERCNLWLLYTALAYGISKVQFICLWDGGGGDGPGGTGHMYKEVNRRTGRVTWIDSRSL